MYETFDKEVDYVTPASTLIHDESHWTNYKQRKKHQLWRNIALYFYGTSYYRAAINDYTQLSTLCEIVWIL
jgi:hypothetical protein